MTIDYKLFFDDIREKNYKIYRIFQEVILQKDKSPSAAIAGARGLIELLLQERLLKNRINLHDAINEISEDVPPSVISYLHMVRRIGNDAVHHNEEHTTRNVVQIINVLVELISFFLEIEVKNINQEVPENKVKIRCFIADPIYKTWSKIAILTQDGILYCEYLHFMNPTIFKRGGFDFELFTAENFKFGGTEHGKDYQSIREVTLEYALNYQLSRQANWVKQYLVKIGFDMP